MERGGGGCGGGEEREEAEEELAVEEGDDEEGDEQGERGEREEEEVGFAQEPGDAVGRARVVLGLPGFECRGLGWPTCGRGGDSGGVCGVTEGLFGVVKSRATTGSANAVEDVAGPGGGFPVAQRDRARAATGERLAMAGRGEV